MAKVLGGILQIDGRAHPVARPYKEFLEILGAGYLEYADISKITVGKYIIHTDGRSNESHLLFPTVEIPRKVEISTGGDIRPSYARLRGDNV